MSVLLLYMQTIADSTQLYNMGAVILPVKLKLNITDIIFWLSVQPQMYVCIGKIWWCACVCVCGGGGGGHSLKLRIKLWAIYITIYENLEGTPPMPPPLPRSHAYHVAPFPWFFAIFVA